MKARTKDTAQYTSKHAISSEKRHFFGEGARLVPDPDPSLVDEATPTSYLFSRQAFEIHPFYPRIPNRFTPCTAYTVYLHSYSACRLTLRALQLGPYGLLQVACSVFVWVYLLCSQFCAVVICNEGLFHIICCQNHVSYSQHLELKCDQLAAIYISMPHQCHHYW